MNFEVNDVELHALLSRTFGRGPPRPDFGAWCARYPAVVAGLGSVPEARHRPEAAALVLVLRWWLARRRLGLLVAAAAGLLIGVVVWSGLRRQDHAPTASLGEAATPAPEDGAKSAPGPKLVLPAPSDGTTGPGIGASPQKSKAGPALYFPTTADRIGLSSAIVRGRMVAVKESQLIVKVSRVIYGRVPSDVFHVESGLPGPNLRGMLRSKLGRDATGDEFQAALADSLNFAPDREAIWMIDSFVQGPDGVVCRPRSTSYDSPPRRSLDRCEEEIVEVLRSGIHLTPPLEKVDFYVQSLPRVRLVRARLVKLDPASTEWQVTRVLLCKEIDAATGRHVPLEVAPFSGAKLPCTWTIPLDSWRLRAEAVVRYRAARDPKSAVTEDDIQKEFRRLVESELRPDQEAVLGVRPEKDTEGRESLRALILFSEGPGRSQTIDRLERQIRERIASDDFSIPKL